MRIGIIATLAYGLVLVVAAVVLLLTGHAPDGGMPATALERLAWCGAMIGGGLAPPALAWLVAGIRLLGRLPALVPAVPKVEEANENAGLPLDAESARVEDRRDFFATLDRYRTSIYNQFIEVFQDTGLIESYRGFKFPDGLPMVDRPCIFLVEHFLHLEQKGEEVPERFNLSNEELQILKRMFDELVEHAKRTNSTFVLRRNDMRVYQMLGGEYP
ncbi:hypothetical protein ACFOGJ_06705 [Marinibaculum pumilum]|uniref:Uncharacterized protein n=1 Tax=Marinibaculum pumilum TaxID=1766165 RepID=A0ABV7KXR2_9PROT